MRRSAFVFAALCALVAPLGACSTLQAVGTAISLNTPQLLTPDRLYQVHLAYETFQTAAVSLRKNVPQCRASQAPSASDICVKRNTLVAIQGIDRQASQTLANIDAWATNNPMIDAAALIDGFTRVIGQGSALIAGANTGKG